MRSLLVGLDTTPASRAAVEFSLALASRFGARLTGIGVLDITYLTSPEPIPLGGAEYKFKADVARVEQAHAQALKLREEFLTRCQSEDAVGQVVLLEGSPADRVRASAATHDAIVIGRDTDFHGQSSAGVAASLEQILKGNPRPVIVTPETVNPLSRVLIAYDGSTPAARALQLFVLLGLARDCEIHVVSADADGGVAQSRTQQVEAYLGLYSYVCSQHAVASITHPAEVVTEYISRVAADLVVMGAYGHRGWRETLFGSSTKRLLSECPTCLFIYH
jgi:nucleotide-binding universal stress UspA family protein